jgi:hypothetical protein
MRWMAAARAKGRAKRPKRLDGSVQGVQSGRLENGSGASEVIASVATAPLEELMTRYPDAWRETGQALVKALESDHAAGAAKFLARARADADSWRQRVTESGDNPRVATAALPALLHERMSQLAVRQAVKQAIAVRGGGQKLRFGLWSGMLIQALFFRRGLARKPVSMRWFRLIWPLVKQKSLLMPLCEPKGIFCFYSRQLIEGLAGLIKELGPGPAVEIAAGDGSLARFLTDAGTPVLATDDHSWSHSIDFPAAVEQLDAESALARHLPRVVLCSWPPPQNRFERQVFAAETVQRYIVITTRHKFAAGDWSAYEDAQAGFDRRVDLRLSSLVLPPEIDPVVLIFDRRR